MSSFEDSTLRIHNLQIPTKSFDELFDKIVDDNDSVKNQSLNSVLFNDETNDTNRTVTKPTDDFITKVSLSSDIFAPELKGDLKQNDCNLSPEKYLDRYLLTQDSVCTECRFSNKQISFFSSFNNTQRQTQSKSFSPCRDQIVDTGEEDPHREKISLKKRSHSVTPEKQHFDIHKKFKSEENISFLINTCANICEIIKPTTAISYTSGRNFHDIVPTTENVDKVCELLPAIEHDSTLNHTYELDGTCLKLFDYDKGSPEASTKHEVNFKELACTESIGKCPTVKKIEKISIVDNVSADKEKNSSLSGKSITLQSQNIDGIDSSRSYSLSSEKTVDEIYCIDDIEHVEHSKNVKLLIEEQHDIYSLKRSSSAFSESTIEEVYYMSTANDIKSQITENLKRESVGMKIGVKDDLESQCLIETELDRIEREGKIIGHNVVAVQLLNDPVTNVNSAKVPELRNGGAFKVLDNSVLEISIESESENNIVKRDRVIGKEKISSSPVADYFRTKFSNSKNVSEQSGEKRNMPIDLTTVNSSRSHDRDIIPLKAADTQNIEKTVLINDLETQLLTDTQLDNIKPQDPMAMKEKANLNYTAGPSANKIFTTAQNTLNRDVDLFKDDLSLECLSEIELRRIEAEAYSKTKERSIFHLGNVNAEGVVNKDVFYRPGKPKTITNKNSDDLVIPNWVTNPAPEPNYDKMKHTIQMQRDYIKIMLQEILRLSDIVAKVGSIVHADHENSDTEAVPKSNSQIGGSRSIPLTENKPNNQSLEPRTSAGEEMDNFHHSSYTVNTDLKNSEIFYVSDSSRPKYSVPYNTVLATAHGPSKDVKGSGKLYDPRSIALQNDLPPILNRSSDVKFERRNISGDYVESGASNMFGSLKRNFGGNKSYGSDLSSVWYNGREKKTGFHSTKWDSNLGSKNWEKTEGVIKADYQLPKINSHSTVSGKDKSVLNMNKFNPVGHKDTIFYSPDEFSSGSINHTALPSVKNSETFFCPSSTQCPFAQVKPERKVVNMSGNSIRDKDDNIFYTGNKKGSGTMKIL